LTLSIEKQCELLSVSRSSFYYQPCQESEINLLLMKEIDQLNTPFMGQEEYRLIYQLSFNRLILKE